MFDAKRCADHRGVVTQSVLCRLESTKRVRIGLSTCIRDQTYQAGWKERRIPHNLQNQGPLGRKSVLILGWLEYHNVLRPMKGLLHYHQPQQASRSSGRSMKEASALTQLARHEGQGHLRWVGRVRGRLEQHRRGFTYRSHQHSPQTHLLDHV